MISCSLTTTSLNDCRYLNQPSFKHVTNKQVFVEIDSAIHRARSVTGDSQKKERIERTNSNIRELGGLIGCENAIDNRLMSSG